jgi:hypothetical protein
MEDSVEIANIPDSLMNEILRRLADHTVAFLRIEDTPHGRDATLLGSGTLVVIGNTFAILTAHHVIAALPSSGRLGILLSPTHEPHSIDRQGLEYLKIARGNVDAVGPDLGAVLLAPSIASSIAAKKSFYNLERQRDKLLHNPPDLRDGLWFVNGFPDENTVVTPDADSGRGFVKWFYNFGGVGTPQESSQIGDHDYFTIPVSPVAHPPVPRRFNGMSGGGLWQVPLKREKSGELVHQSPLLSGVAFYQAGITAAGSDLKCHGRRSVYGVAYDAIARETYQ